MSNCYLPAIAYEIIAQMQSRISDPTVPQEDQLAARTTMLKIITTFATVGLNDFQRPILAARLGVQAMMSFRKPHRYAVDLLAVVADHNEVLRD